MRSFRSSHGLSNKGRRRGKVRVMHIHMAARIMRSTAASSVPCEGRYNNRFGDFRLDPSVARRRSTEKRETPTLKAAACWMLVVATFVSSAHAGNWAHWRGPTGNGTAPNASPPIEWSNTKNVRWKIAIAGSGLSSPIVWENQVFVTTAVPLEGQGGADFQRWSSSSSVSIEAMAG